MGGFCLPHHIFPTAAKLAFKQNYQIACECYHLNQCLASPLSKLFLIVEV